MMKYIRRKGGSYTVEAAIFLPLIIIAVLTVGMFIKVDSAWENCINSAIDECEYAASKACNGGSQLGLARTIERRVTAENDDIVCDVDSVKYDYFGMLSDHVVSLKVNGQLELKMPLDFGRSSSFSGKIKYREFCGKATEGSGMGTEGLETYEGENPVWIFPQLGVRYHNKNCTYVTASVHHEVLNAKIMNSRDTCEICKSSTLGIGSVVAVFGSSDSAYHRVDCRTIDRQTIVIDATEARERGYTPCTKCNPD